MQQPLEVISDINPTTGEQLLKGKFTNAKHAITMTTSDMSASCMLRRSVSETLPDN